jgi:hypothetical protein
VCVLAPDAVKHWKAVQELAGKAMQANPKGVEETVTLALAQSRGGDHQTGVPVLRAAALLRKDGGGPTAWLAEAILLARGGKPDEARPLLEKAARWHDAARQQPVKTSSGWARTWRITPWDDRVRIETLRREAEGLLGKGK